MRQIIVTLALFIVISANAANLEVTVNDAWGKATAPGQDNGTIQFSIVSKKEAKLVSISSPVAGKVEIHSMVHEDGMMKMRPVEFIALPSEKWIDLRKTGNHVMLLNLKQPLKVGDNIPLSLTIEYPDKHRTTVEAKAAIKPQGSSQDMHDMKGM
jgi:copper(I)-binding protein